MTECNSQPISFSSVGRRRLLADFDGGSITSDAGALLLREADRRLCLIDRLDAVIPDPRNQSLITHHQATMLRQRIFAIAMGYEDGNDHQQLRDDPLMQLGLFADRTSCHEFVPNQFRVMLSAAAYVLLQHIRQTALAGTELAEAQVSTIRLKLLKLGGLVKRSTRRIVLHLASGCPHQHLFRLIAAKLTTLLSTA